MRLMNDSDTINEYNMVYNLWCIVFRKDTGSHDILIMTQCTLVIESSVGDSISVIYFSYNVM